MELNKLVFPAPQPSYDENLYLKNEGSLIFIPRIKLQSPKKKTIVEETNTTNFSFSKKKFVEGQINSKPKPDGHIPCLYMPFTDEFGKYSNLLLIYFHGNAEDIYLAYELLSNLKNELKVNVLAMEYPGYGIYPGETKADKICEDSLIVFDYLNLEMGLSENNIIIFGRSIGTGPATYLASQRNPGALILMSAYISIKAVVTHLVGKMLAWAVAERFRNIENIKNVNCPVFFLHGKMDELIPCEHSKELYNNSNVGEFWFPNQMTHNSFNVLRDLLIPIDTFLDKYKIKVKLEDKKCVNFPEKIFVYPNEKNNKGSSSVISSIYNRFFDKK